MTKEMMDLVKNQNETSNTLNEAKLGLFREMVDWLKKTKD